MTRLHGKTAPGTRLNSSTKGGEIEVKDPNWVGIQMCLMPITLPENILKNARMSPPQKKKGTIKTKPEMSGLKQPLTFQVRTARFLREYSVVPSGKIT